MYVRCSLLTILFMAAAMIGLGPAQAQVWDASTQFSTTSNTPADTWQYLYALGDGSNNSGYANFAAWQVGAPGYEVWCNNTAWHFVGQNLAVFDGLVAHPYGPPLPGNVHYVSVVGWLSPITGAVNTQFSVTDLDGGGGDGVVWNLFKSGDTAPLSTGSIGNGGASGTISVNNVSVVAGDMLYLQVFDGPEVTYDLTGVNFTVSTVPEPGTFALVACAMMGLVACAWKKRCWR